LKKKKISRTVMILKKGKGKLKETHQTDTGKRE